MEKCYIINAPWVFYALWKGLQPLMSAGTAKKVQVRCYYAFLRRQRAQHIVGSCFSCVLFSLFWVGGACDVRYFRGGTAVQQYGRKLLCAARKLR